MVIGMGYWKLDSGMKAISLNCGKMVVFHGRGIVDGWMEV
jgi:hypothetical protein